jgi:hypothetical protein
MRYFPFFLFSLSLDREIPQWVFSNCETFRTSIERWFTTFLFWTITRVRAVKNFLLHVLRNEGNRSIETTWRTLVRRVLGKKHMSWMTLKPTPISTIMMRWRTRRKWQYRQIYDEKLWCGARNLPHGTGYTTSDSGGWWCSSKRSLRVCNPWNPWVRVYVSCRPDEFGRCSLGDIEEGSSYTGSCSCELFGLCLLRHRASDFETVMFTGMLCWPMIVRKSRCSGAGEQGSSVWSRIDPTRLLSSSGIICLSKRSNLLSYDHLAYSVGSGNLYQSVKDGQFPIDTCTGPEYLTPLGSVCNSILGKWSIWCLCDTLVSLLLDMCIPLWYWFESDRIS